MDKQLDTRFDRVEKALGTLADSIAKYNPSTHSAREFVAADAELSKGLEELQTHQFNHRRLQDLRSASASLDAQIKDTLRLLATTRKELVSTPATVFPDGASRHYHDIDYDELLRYARMISKTTMPPVGAINGLPTPPTEPIPGTGAGGVEIVGPGIGIETAATTPGATPGGAATPNGGGMTPQPHQSGSDQQPPPSSQQQSQQPPSASQATTAIGTSFNSTTNNSNSTSTPDANNTSTTATMHQLPEIISTHLNPYAQLQFAPWPGEDGVRGGGLAALALLSDRGVDPEGYDPEAERARREAEEEARRAREERERREREEHERRVREEQAARIRAARESNMGGSGGSNGGSGQAEESWRRASVVGAGPAGPGSSPTGEKKQFQFMGDLDDDDDDD